MLKWSMRLDPNWVVDETAQDPLAKHIGRTEAVGERVAGPARVSVLDVLCSLKEIGIHPMSPSVRRR